MSKSLILFRFHDNAEVALERIRFLKHLNPAMKVHVLYGGELADEAEAKALVVNEAESFWAYPVAKEKSWKWSHTDLVLKQWYRAVGADLEFDVLYSHEYDMLLMTPLETIYPKISQRQIALAACEPFTNEIESRWRWTSVSPWKEGYLEFCEYLRKNYGIARQAKVCLGPGPMLSKSFLDAWSETEDVDLVHDELAYPAYAEALGFDCVNNNLHPGFGEHPEGKYFSCESNAQVTNEMIVEQLARKDGMRAFHPVKQMVRLDEAQSWLGIVPS